MGRGGFGVVFAGFHLTLEIPVAIKVLHTDFAGATDRDRAFERFHQEAKTLAQLRHPNIARVLDTGVLHHEGLPDLPWLVMEWCAGPTLTEVLADRTSGSSRAAVWRLMRPVIDAVAHAHEQGIVHRDLKPDNIILVDGSPRVLDFGIAKVMAREAPASDTAPTRSAERAFTPAYGAPEQFAGVRTGPWTDVHALALILTEALTGRRAYRNLEGAELMREALGHRRPTPGAAGVDVGPWEDVIERALADNPSDRFEDGRALLEALQRHAPALDTALQDAPPTGSVVDPPADVSSERERRESAPTELATGPGADTLAPESDAGRDAGPRAGPTATEEPLALPEPTPRRPAVPRLVAAVVAVAAVLAVAWVGWSRLTARSERLGVRLTSPTGVSPTAISPSVPPAIPTQHPHDDFDGGLLAARLERRGWRVTKRLKEGEVIESLRIEREGMRGSVVVFRADESKSIDHSVDASTDTASLRRGRSVLHVYLHGDLAAAETLRDALAETSIPTVDSGPRPVADSPWEAFDVPAGVELNDAWPLANGGVVVAGDHGVVVGFDGRAWRREETGATDDIYSLWGNEAGEVYAVGESGLLLRRGTDGWERETSGTSQRISEVLGDGDRVVAVTDGAVLERQRDRWVTVPRRTDSLLVTGYFEGHELFVVEAGGAVYRWDEGREVRLAAWPETRGLSWPLIASPGATNINPSMAPWLASQQDLRWAPRAFTVFGPNLMVVGTVGVILRVAHGVDVEVEPSGTEATLSAVRRADDGTFWAVGERGTVLRRRP